MDLWTLSLTLILFLIVLVAVAVQRPAAPAAGPVRSWVCYYGADRLSDTVVDADLVVVDGTCHRNLMRRPDGRPLYLGYVSIGEVAVGGPWWERATGGSFLLRHNGFWNAWTVDAADPKWQDLVAGEMVPAVLARGFDGIFIDGVDQALELTPAGSRDRQRCREALIGMIERIRKTHPGIKIALNRGLDLLDMTVTRIDFLVLEGLFSIYDAQAGNYRPVAPFGRDQVLGRLNQALRADPGLPVLTLDYAPDPSDDLAAGAVAFARENGFVPYVSTWRLDVVFALPEAPSKEEKAVAVTGMHTDAHG